MPIKTILFVFIAFTIGYATSPSNASDAISCDSFEGCADGSVDVTNQLLQMQAEIAALQVDVVGASEVVWLMTGALNSPNFVPDRKFKLIDFTTTTSGTAIIELKAGYTLICESTGAWHYLIVDGAPVEGSQVFTRGSGTGPRSHEGAVEQFAAGDHTAELGGECFSSTSLSYTVSTTQWLKVIVDAN
jgi:hypothetical protein